MPKAGVFSIRLITDDFEKTITEIETSMGLAVTKSVEQIADILLNDIKRSISTPYPPASVQGEPPHMRTGNLRKSGKKQLRNRLGRYTKAGTNDAVSFGIVFNARYASYLEGEYLNRPFIAPAIDKFEMKLLSLKVSSNFKGLKR